MIKIIKIMAFKRFTKFKPFSSGGDGKKDLRSFLSINLGSERHIISASLKLQLFRDIDDAGGDMRVEVVHDPASGNWYIAPSVGEKGFLIFGHRGRDGDIVSYRVWNFQGVASAMMRSFNVSEVSQKFIVDDSSARYNDRKMYRIMLCY